MIKKNVVLYVQIFVFCLIGLIFLNVLGFSYVVLNEKNFLDKQSSFQQAIQEEVVQNSIKNGVSESLKENLIKQKMFMMLLDENGDIIISANLPEALNKHYTIKDIARFTRYYLEGYPIQTFIEEEGLLIIGNEKGSQWKYNLVYNINTVQRLFLLVPIFLVLNIIVLITLPLFIQKKVLQKKKRKEFSGLLDYLMILEHL